MEQYKFSYADVAIPTKEMLLDTHAHAGDIAVVVVALEYEMRGQIYNREKRWLPVGVVAMGRMG